MPDQDTVGRGEGKEMQARLAQTIRCGSHVRSQTCSSCCAHRPTARAGNPGKPTPPRWEVHLVVAPRSISPYATHFRRPASSPSLSTRAPGPGVPTSGGPSVPRSPSYWKHWVRTRRSSGPRRLLGRRAGPRGQALACPPAPLFAWEASWVGYITEGMIASTFLNRRVRHRCVGMAPPRSLSEENLAGEDRRARLSRRPSPPVVRRRASEMVVSHHRHVPQSRTCGEASPDRARMCRPLLLRRRPCPVGVRRDTPGPLRASLVANPPAIQSWQDRSWRAQSPSAPCLSALAGLLCNLCPSVLSRGTVHRWPLQSLM